MPAPTPVLNFTLERMDSPLGTILLVLDTQQHLRALDWLDHEARMHTLMRRQYVGQRVHLATTSTRSAAAKAIQLYFEGDDSGMNQLPIAFGGTTFQREVWTALRDIPQGQTISYGELAHRIGRPQAVRAVGLANGANPISIVLPCHRVIGSNRSLTGYGGGLQRKHWLLAHEHALPPGMDEPPMARLPGF